MLLLAANEDVDLASTGRQRPEAAPHSEQEKLCHVPEIETDPPAVWPAVLPDLVPNDVGLVREPPSLHDAETLGESRVWAPEVQGTLVERRLRNRESRNLLEAHGGVPAKPLVLRSHLAGPVGEPPGRIDEDGPESATKACEGVCR